MRAILILAAVFIWGTSPVSASDAPVMCERLTHNEVEALVCTVDVTRADLRMFHANPAGRAYGGFGPLMRELGKSGKTLTFAMNGGMYHEDLSPVGLYVEDGETTKRANTRPGPGNFHMLPNGVFWIGEDRAGVSETKAFLASGRKPVHATQSGPMLVINGKLHRRFLVNSDSRKIRNGVGVRDGGRTAVFALSRGRVTFHDFATLFRDALKCNDALFLDGSISSLHAPQLGWSDRLFPMGPIIGVVD